LLDFEKERKRFEEQCTACGACVEACPIIPWTDAASEDPGKVMESVLDLYRTGTADDRARTRILSCMGCLACRSHCPEDLDPSVGLSIAMSMLRDGGEPVPGALSFLLPQADFNFMKAVEAFQITPDQRPWVTDVEKERPGYAGIVLFTGCTGIMQPDVIATALEIIRRLDPTAQALGGVDYCCGDTTLRAGDPERASSQFQELIQALNAFSPENVVFLCPTCKMYTDQQSADTDWSGHFVTQFLEERLDQLGPFSEIQATVTVHDACHLVRGRAPEFESPRQLLRAIPGIRIIEMENSRESALCCGATAMAAVGKPGVELRKFRLNQAQKTGADIMSLYCPACQSIFAPEVPDLPFRVESILALLGRSLGIVHEDRLQRYQAYHDAERVLREAEGCLRGSNLPQETLRAFCARFFR
jgi:heterodisulfide reductase subunit D